MQHLQYGINFLSKFAVARRLPLLRGTLFSRALDPSRHPSPCDRPRLIFGPPAEHARVRPINDFDVKLLRFYFCFYCIVLQTVVFCCELAVRRSVRRIQ